MFSIAIALVDISYELANLVPLPYNSDRCRRYFNRLHEFFVTIRAFYKDVYANRFFPWTSRILLFEIHYYELCHNGLKYRVSRNLLSFGLF